MNIFESRNVRPMYAGREGVPFNNPDFIYELRLNGERCIAYLDRDSTVLFRKRLRNLQLKLPELFRLHEDVGVRCILDGELTVMKNGRSADETGGNRPSAFVAHDILYYQDEQITDLPLLQRKAILRDTVKDNERICVARYIDEQGIALCQLAEDEDLEGVVAKRKKSVYQPGCRSEDWIQVRNIMDDDYVIGGYVINDSRNVSLLLGQYDDKRHLLYKGSVLDGVNREDFQIISKLKEIPARPFTDVPPDSQKEAVWVDPRLVCRVRFNGRNVNGSLRQPVYEMLRPEKTPDEALAPEVLQSAGPGNGPVAPDRRR